ncbi:FadR/GntR family transcriptional regulator [Rhodophyticola sp. CCM32]|uniref:FadR/GntR family transcriptional regulator n=1 Tax=Rhodophyticola sp. CCM32 TaxID=2916397 RepID=UPI00143DC639|nr:FadR/GntR family transcriptional regulator [Rhodophyticola sp. CCM32]
MSALDLPSGGRRYLQIAQDLADQITAGAYQSGDRLPPERELSVQLEVSRTTVREALLALEIMRYVEIRVGAGVFVLPEHLRGQENGDLISPETVGPWEVLEARRMVEGHSAFAAAGRMTPAMLEQIGATITRMEAAINDIPKFDMADAEFHALIARAGGNALIESYVAHLWAMRGNSLWQTWYDQTRKVENRRRSISCHKAIYRALQRGQADVARTAMESHLDMLADRFFELNL